MSKQKIIVLVSLIFVFLILAFFVVKIFAGKMAVKQEEIAKEEQEKVALVKNTSDDFKNSICSDQNKPLDLAEISAKLSDPQNQEIIKSSLSKDEMLNLQGYYFCDGFLKNNVEEACGNDLRTKEKNNQCKNSFNFFQMIFASLNGQRDKAGDLCKTTIGVDKICQNVGSLQEIKNKNICAEVPEENKPFCYAFFAGDGKYCENGKDVEFCKNSANFLGILTSQGDENQCDSIIVSDELDNRDILCRVKLSKNQNICFEYKYKKFLQSFCRNE